MRSGDELIVVANGKQKTFSLGNIVYVDDHGGIYRLDEPWPSARMIPPDVEEARQFLERVSKRLYEAEKEEAADESEQMD